MTVKKSPKIITSFALVITIVFSFFYCYSFDADFSVSASQVIETGVYNIYSSLSATKVADAKNGSTNEGTNIQLYDANSTVAQIYRIVPMIDNYYAIQMASTYDMVLTVEGKGNSGCNVKLSSFTGSDSQLWEFISTGSQGEYYIVSKSGQYLDVSMGHTDNGTNIQVYEKNQTASQKWKLKKNYDAEKAISYALKYTDDSAEMEGTYNSEYNIYKYPNQLGYGGYDCTNYISQCAYAGGMLETNNWKRVLRGTTKNKVSENNVWFKASGYYNYLKNLGYQTERVNNDYSNIHKGDLVFLSGDDGTESSIHHGTICTKVENGITYYSAHSCWRKNYPYNKSSGTWYVVHMSFCNTENSIKIFSNSSASSANKTYTISSTSGAKVRINAGTSASQVGGLAKGSVITYDKTESKDGYTWYHIVSVDAKSGSWGTSYEGNWIAGV